MHLLLPIKSTHEVIQVHQERPDDEADWPRVPMPDLPDERDNVQDDTGKRQDYECDVCHAAWGLVGDEKTPYHLLPRYLAAVVTPCSFFQQMCKVHKRRRSTIGFLIHYSMLHKSEAFRS